MGNELTIPSNSNTFLPSFLLVFLCLLSLGRDRYGSGCENTKEEKEKTG
jgi:hypothetical protein